MRAVGAQSRRWPTVKRQPNNKQEKKKVKKKKKSAQGEKKKRHKKNIKKRKKKIKKQKTAKPPHTDLVHRVLERVDIASLVLEPEEDALDLLEAIHVMVRQRYVLQRCTQRRRNVVQVQRATPAARKHRRAAWTLGKRGEKKHGEGGTERRNSGRDEINKRRERK
jgi:hypothetical protein